MQPKESPRARSEDRSLQGDRDLGGKADCFRKLMADLERAVSQPEPEQWQAERWDGMS